MSTKEQREESRALSTEASEGAAAAFAKELAATKRFYWWLIIGCGALCAAAVVLAIYIRVSLGLSVAVIAALCYHLLLEDMLKKRLSLRVSNRRGRARVTLLRGKEEQWIPDRLLWLDVTCLSAAENAEGLENVRILRLPGSIQRIETGAIEKMTALERVEFDGTEREWQKMEKPAELSRCVIVCLRENGENP